MLFKCRSTNVNPSSQVSSCKLFTQDVSVLARKTGISLEALTGSRLEIANAAVRALHEA